MVTSINGNGNGFHTNGTNSTHAFIMKPCQSDYPEPIDMVPFTPTPKPKADWTAHVAPYTDTIKWLTPEGIEHSLTIRASSLADLMRDEREIKAMILASREQHATQHSARGEADQPEAEPLTKPCQIHNGTLMKKRQSRSGGHFFSHRLENGSWCSGKA